MRRLSVDVWWQHWRRRWRHRWCGRPRRRRPGRPGAHDRTELPATVSGVRFRRRRKHQWQRRRSDAKLFGQRGALRSAAECGTAGSTVAHTLEPDVAGTTSESTFQVYILKLICFFMLYLYTSLSKSFLLV